MLQIIRGAGRRRHVDHTIASAFDGKARGDVRGDEEEPGVTGEVGEVGVRAGRKIIWRDHAVALRQQTVAHVRPDKPGGAGDNYSKGLSIHPIPTKTGGSTCYIQN